MVAHDHSHPNKLFLSSTSARLVSQLFKASMAIQIYGYQNMEGDSSAECLLRRNALGQEPANAPVVIGSKYFTIPWTNFLIGGNFRFGLQPLSDALDGTLQRLGQDSVDLYMVHFPFVTYPIQACALATAFVAWCQW